MIILLFGLQAPGWLQGGKYPGMAVEHGARRIKLPACRFRLSIPAAIKGQHMDKAEQRRAGHTFVEIISPVRSSWDILPLYFPAVCLERAGHFPLEDFLMARKQFFRDATRT